MYLLYVYGCLCTMCPWRPEEGIKSLGLGLWEVLAAMYVLGVAPGSSAYSSQLLSRLSSSLSFRKTKQNKTRD